jgi:hypothetical protein
MKNVPLGGTLVQQKTEVRRQEITCSSTERDGVLAGNAHKEVRNAKKRRDSMRAPAADGKYHFGQLAIGEQAICRDVNTLSDNLGSGPALADIVVSGAAIINLTGQKCR